MKEDIQVDRFISYLQSKLWEERAVAITELAGADDPRITPLILRFLKDPVTGVRGSAREALCIRKDLKISDLERLLDDQDFHVRASAISVLGWFGKEAIPLLAKASKDKDPIVRESVAVGLRIIEDPDSLPILSILADDPKSDVQIEAIEAINHIKNQVAEDAIDRVILEELRESNRDDEELSKEADSGSLQRILNDSDKRSLNVVARIYAAKELGKRGEVDAIPSLMEAMADPNEIVRGTAAMALDHILDKCTTIDELDAFELRMNEGMNSVPEWPMTKDFKLLYRLQNAKVGMLDGKLENKQQTAKAEMKEMLDMPKPKPPKNGNGSPGGQKRYLKLV